MRGPASGDWIPWGPMSLGHAHHRRLCPCSCSGPPMSLGMPPLGMGWMFALARGGQGTNSTDTGAMNDSGVLSKGEEEVSDQSGLGSFHSRVHANDMEISCFFSSLSIIAASCLGSFTPGRGRGKTKTWSYNSQPSEKGPWLFVRCRDVLGTKYLPFPCFSPM